MSRSLNEGLNHAEEASSGYTQMACEILEAVLERLASAGLRRNAGDLQLIINECLRPLIQTVIKVNFQVPPLPPRFMGRQLMQYVDRATT